MGGEVLDDPEFAGWMVDDGDGFFGGGRDLVVTAFEVDGVVVVDAPLVAKGEVEIEQWGHGSWAEAVGFGEKCALPYDVGDEAGAALTGEVLAVEFHLKDLVRLRGGGDFCIGKQGDHPSLKGAEAAFDFAFGLGCRGDEMGDAEAAQSALKFALWVAVVGAGAGAEKAERIGVDGLWDAVEFKGGAEVGEVIPGGIGRDQTARDIEAGMVVQSEEENLLLRSGPPLVDGAIVLPKLANMSAVETPVTPLAWRRWREEMREMFFEISLHAGTSAYKAKEALQLIHHELEIGRGG